MTNANESNRPKFRVFQAGDNHPTTKKSATFGAEKPGKKAVTKRLKPAPKVQPKPTKPQWIIWHDELLGIAKQAIAEAGPLKPGQWLDTPIMTTRAKAILRQRYGYKRLISDVADRLSDLVSEEVKLANIRAKEPEPMTKAVLSKAIGDAITKFEKQFRRPVDPRTTGYYDVLQFVLNECLPVGFRERAQTAYWKKRIQTAVVAEIRFRYIARQGSKTARQA